MSTSAKDRLDKLLEGKPKPDVPDPTKPDFADSELRSVQQKHQPLEASIVGTTLDEMAGGQIRQPREIDQMTSSDDDDDYVSAFKQRPAMQPQRPSRRMKPKPRVMPEPDAFGYPKDAYIEPLAPLKYLPKGKLSDNILPNYPSDTESPSESGELPTEDTDGNRVTGHFCILQLVAKFPYKYMVDDNDRVSRHFFAQNKFWNRQWDIYYINPPGCLLSQAILLLPYSQVKDLIDSISRAFKIEMNVPVDPFTLSFFEDGSPQPTFLGISNSKEEVGELQASIPMVSDNYAVTPENASPALDRSFAAFKAKMERAVAANKKKNTAIRKKKANDRLLAVQNHVQQLKRTQRYLGLRPRTAKPIDPDPSLSWADQEAFRKEQLKKCKIILDPLRVEKAVPYPFDKDPVLVTIDVEAYERGHHIITEIGVSTLDTEDLVSLPPGKGGELWRQQIRSRHFRIKGRELLRNKDFCIGKPDGFDFGTSEFVTVDEAADAVDTCFEHPFSAGFQHPGHTEAIDSTEHEEGPQSPPGSGRINPKMRAGSITSIDGIDARGPTNADHNAVNKAVAEKLLGALRERDGFSEGKGKDTAQPKANPKNRTIILVGHNVSSDLAFLEALGSKIFSASRSTYPVAAMEMMSDGSGKAHVLASIVEALDTAVLYRVLKKEAQTRSLANTLADLGICGWSLHNAGNDARYTLEALIALAIKARLEDDKVQAKKEHDLAGANGGKQEQIEWEIEETRRVEEKLEAARRDVLEECEIWEKAGATGTARASSSSPAAERLSTGVNTRGVFATSLPIVSTDRDAPDDNESCSSLADQTNRKLKLEEEAEQDPWLAAQLGEENHKQYGTDEVFSAVTASQEAELDDGGSPTVTFSQLLSDNGQKKDAKKKNALQKQREVEQADRTEVDPQGDWWDGGAEGSAW